MKLSRTAAYAVHVMVFIAQHAEDRQPIRGHVAAKELDIPEGFLLRILVALSRTGLLRSLKGPNGGYNLGRSAKEITMLDILEAAEGSMKGMSDAIANPPDMVDKKLQEAALAATETVRKHLAGVTLADLMGGRKKAK